MEVTTIAIYKKDGKRLDKLKIHSRQPDKEIISIILDAYEKSLSEK